MRLARWLRSWRRGTAAARRDMRWRAAAIALVVLAGGGGVLAWIGGVISRPEIQAAEPDPRAQPRAHGDHKRREEIAARFSQGVAMLHAKQHEYALTAFHRVLELAPDMPEAHVNMGYALIGLGRFEAARAFFEGATELRPRQVNAYWGLAIALEAAGDVAGAIGAMRTYVHLTRSDDPYRRKGEAALWEWETKIAAQRGESAQGLPPLRKAK
jgi:Flp pilus assembly protein TadD